MNLRNIANGLTRTVNPNLTVQWRAFTGYTTAATGKTTPTYATAVDLVAQVQALTKKEIEHLDALNLSTCERAAYVNGQISAIDRIAQTGGDLLIFEGRTWLVTAILEGWTSAGWCKVALTQQQGV